MPYCDDYEYTQEIRDEIEDTIKEFYGDGTIVEWYKINDSLNFKYKVDTGVITMLRDSGMLLSMQIKRSNYKGTFSITKAAMDSYITDNLSINGLIVCLAKKDYLYLFPWKRFTDLALEMRHLWEKNGYYVIPIKMLTDNIQYKKMKIPKL